MIYSEFVVSDAKSADNHVLAVHNGACLMPGRPHENNIIPKLLMSLGALVYLLGIWRTCPLFSGKGYFLGVLVMGMFAILAHQRTMQ